MRDVVYIFDKLSPYTRVELGEIQTAFNMSFTIDGTKDSTKLIVRSFSGDEIEPYTILQHYNTNTWWVVTNDKVERYTNEDGFIYVHTIQCSGAKELLNARDLTDCGFNDNTYTVDQLLKRLVKLSKWDFPNVDFVYGNNIDSTQLVNYIKTFENYTLFSAIREFLDGYNCDFTLTFTTNANGSLNRAKINIIPKTGNVDLTTLDESMFKDVREIKKIDKNSFGTTVVSNAENVISSVAKTYPSQGSVRLSGNEYTITAETAVLRLPSKVYKMNWLKMYFSIHLKLWDTFSSNQPISLDFYVNVANQKALDNFEDTFESELRSWLSRSESWYQGVMSAFHAQIDTILDKIKRGGTVSFYEGNSLNPVNIVNNVNQPYIVKGADVPYIPKVADGNNNFDVILTDKATRDCLPLKKQGIYWTRGSDLIQGWDFLGTNSMAGGILTWSSSLVNYHSTDLYNESSAVIFSTTQEQDVLSLEVTQKLELKIKDMSFVVNYIPMSDLKLEIDNQNSSKDMQLYNQNGRLTDSVALSKILNSYSREISSDNITRYMDYYGFSNCPKAGQMVKYNNQLYVINDISFDFYPNENDSYFINAEINMCKYVSTKSLMVNPNTNIRDYGIPQNFNVVRKQLYRDYLEFAYTPDTHADSSFYMTNNLPIDLTTLPSNNAYRRNGVQVLSHTVGIRCTYKNQVDNSYYWFYQVETTTYRLDKMYIEVLDFKDNNIIGYGNQNTHSAFQLSRIFQGFLDTINTPISYVDENGNVEGFMLRYANQDQLTYVWNLYQSQTAYANNTSYDPTNFSVLIPTYIFSEMEDNCDMQIDEPAYQKDATEVPMFEYVFQVGDSDDVLIGDKILDNARVEEDKLYDFVWFYYIVKKNAGTLNQINAQKYAYDIEESVSLDILDNAINITEYSNAIDITIRSDVSFSPITWNGVSYGSVV